MDRHTAVIDGVRTVWRQAPWEGDVPAVHVHGVPTYSFDWEPLLARAGGLAPDLPGFGEILRLYRSMSDEDHEVHARSVASRFAGLTAPTLVVWGDRDPYISSWFGDVYAAKLPNARTERLPDAGHRASVDDPAAADRAVTFLRTGR